MFYFWKGKAVRIVFDWLTLERNILMPNRLLQNRIFDRRKNEMPGSSLCFAGTSRFWTNRIFA
jgi:hypothetical protein